MLLKVLALNDPVALINGCMSSHTVILPFMASLEKRPYDINFKLSAEEAWILGEVNTILCVIIKFKLKAEVIKSIHTIP